MPEKLDLRSEKSVSRPVDEFHSASLHGDVLYYPGDRPEHSFVTDGRDVLEVITRNEDGRLSFGVQGTMGEVDINTYLSERGAEPMEDRIPLLAYGANVCPGSLLSKFDKVQRPDALVIPTIYANLPGHDVVWSAGPGQNGNFIATLYEGPETKETSVQVGINFMTREQLLVMHATELAYSFQKMTIPVEGVPLPVYFYAGQDEIFIEDGKPIALETIPAKHRSLTARTTTAMLERVITDPQIVSQLEALRPDINEHFQSARAYTEYVKSLRKKPGDETPRGDLKKQFHKTLGELGMSKLSDTSGSETASRANPSTIPTFGQWVNGEISNHLMVLPSSELKLNMWSDAEARNKVLRGLSLHLHRNYPANEAEVSKWTDPALRDKVRRALAIHFDRKNLTNKP